MRHSKYTEAKVEHEFSYAGAQRERRKTQCGPAYVTLVMSRNSRIAFFWLLLPPNYSSQHCDHMTSLKTRTDQNTNHLAQKSATIDMAPLMALDASKPSPKQGQSRQHGWVRD